MKSIGGRAMPMRPARELYESLPKEGQYIFTAVSKAETRPL